MATPMRDDVLAIPDHVRDALWRVESARLEPVEAAGVFACGMGGSAIGADLAGAALGDRLTRPMLTVRGYELPSWATPEWLSLCCSYSGDTEETLACFAAAEALGAPRVVAGTGGALVEEAREAGVPVIGLPGVFQPRAAVGYMLVVALEVAALSGVAPRIRTELDAAATSLDAAASALDERASELAEALKGRVPVVCGADLTAPVARRWKTQVNENAKLPAFFSELPEADHNELAGWDGAGDHELAAVFLADPDQHPREVRRIELTAAAVEAAGVPASIVETQGSTRIERLLWAVVLGDLVSVALAEGRGVDPVPVEAIERLKDALGRP